MANERLIPSQGDWKIYGQQHLQRYQFALDRARGLDVLDLACGVGYGSFVLSQTAKSCQGVDLSADAIAYAQATYRRANLAYRVGNALSPLSPEASFDAAVSFETIEHLTDPRALIANVHRMLRPDGLFLVSAPNAIQHSRSKIPERNEFHLSEPAYEELVQWLNPWFRIEEEWEQSPVLSFLGLEAISQWRNEQDRRRLKARRVMAASLRVMESAERSLRAFFGKALPLVHAAESADSIVAHLTDVLPLLPERRQICDVFLFVCRRRNSLNPAPGFRP
jgi:SAM-dependent methyltransferase